MLYFLLGYVLPCDDKMYQFRFQTVDAEKRVLRNWGVSTPFKFQTSLDKLLSEEDEDFIILSSQAESFQEVR